ncbi:ras GEF [Wolfiporia cocos MD-104 SS10]|uniref:Ras GEF n=1 Tax=Wolfiporia cocos (strain MD-104) TaxID=742152 RepID=A0A2H3JQY3_WOLCO|nr:ras GEF [Wolfiporia cocos MD-104 SS10]
MATAAYGVQRTMAAPSGFGSEQDVQQSAGEEQYISTFFCRALYDYQTPDASSLSFRKGDIIEVLTQLESGWWDGLLGDERGWFPSNYVTVISDQEAEAALGISDAGVAQTPPADEGVVDMAHSMSRAISQSDREGDWLNGDAEYPSHAHHSDRPDPYPNGVHAKSTQHNDFWVPQVSQDGRIFYVNTQTGQHSRDLPQENEEDTDGDLAGLTSPSSSRAPGAGLAGLATINGMNREHSTSAGFVIPKRSRTPDLWIRRLADDGLSYYYVNKLDGTVSWTPPESSTPPSRDASTSQSHASDLGSRNGSVSSRDHPAGRMRSVSSVSGPRDRSDSTTGRYDSDDSDVIPTRRNRSGSAASMKRYANGSGYPQPTPRRIELTPPEQLARQLQQAMAPPASESPMELSNRVREAIAAISEHLQVATTPRRPEHFKEVDKRVLEVVSTVRNLLYVTATPSGHIPSNLYPRDTRDARPTAATQSLQTHLKAAQRKVAGTLSKLVLSALAMQYDPGLSAADKPNRIESDVAELEKAVVAFVTEVHYFQEQNALPPGASKTNTKRLHGVFSTTNVGLGLPGAGAAGSWRGFGYVPLGEPAQSLQGFANDQVSELKLAARALGDRLTAVTALLKRADHERERLKREVQNVVTHLSSILDFVGTIDIARHVDVDGVRLEASPSAGHSQYLQTVENARLLIRTMEASLQSLFDDGITLLMAAQGIRCDGIVEDDDSYSDYMDTLVAAIASNTSTAVQSLEALLAVGYDQADISQGDYIDSIEWRKSRPLDVPDAEEEMVDMALALGRPPVRAMNSMDSHQSSTTLHYDSAQPSESSVDMSGRSRLDDMNDPVSPTWPPPDSSESTLAAQASPEMGTTEGLADVDEDDATSAAKPRGGAAAAKILKILGDDAPKHILQKLNADSKPWYLRPNYDQSEILMEPDGTVRAGTPAALVERLTAHEHGDTTFNQNFLLTFKSFMTVDELFELLVHRFWIQAPPNLSPSEFEEWTKLKQTVIRMRVLNTFKTMVTDDGILESGDMYILAKMKEFASNEEVVTFAAAKQLLILIERAQRGGDAPIKISTVPTAPPAPVLPKNAKKLKLQDIDPLEIARQLTLMEAAMYKKIRPTECLRRSRETKPGRNSDNFSLIIQLSNRIANWVAESVLEKEDSRKRAVIVKHFISVADRCRVMQNYSTMTAIVSGLATPPIRRLKRTWEQVNQRYMNSLRICESTIDTAKNFNNYRSTLARITPPCVPFIGVYLTTLTFINDGAEDKLAGNMINFRKRQKAAEVIQDIKRWQSMPYNYQTVASVLAYLEECFAKYADAFDYADQFWNLSLEREPREREDEKMARLLQESGFL